MLDELQSKIQSMEGKVYHLHQLYNDDADNASMQAVIDLLQAQVETKVAQYKSKSSLLILHD